MELDREMGSFYSLANKIGVPMDMLIFFFGELFCLICSVLYYKFLPTNTSSAAVRYKVAMILGILVGIFSFGVQFGHVIVQSTLCYLAIVLLPISFMHLVVFVVAMSYLVALHLYRAFVLPEDILYSIDVSGPLMIMTQKITSLAFSIRDGSLDKKDKLSDLQKRYMISNRPSMLEYYSYILYFQGIVVGPLSFFNDYRAYVEGTDFCKKDKNNGMESDSLCQTNKPSPFHSVAYKLAITLFWMLIHFTLKPLYPETLNSDPEFIQSHGFLYRIWYVLFSMLCCRAKYYVAFTLGDVICNASGFGFNGFDNKSRPRWDLVTNVSILGIETATSLKVYLDNWNIQTAVWLRHVCYDRMPVQKRFATFFLSAMWHGCYPGYYFTFISGAIFSESARQVRRKIRPYFQSSQQLQLVYAILTWLGTHLVISYMVVPFTVLHLNHTLFFYTHNVYWSIHILCALSFFILPYIPIEKRECTQRSLEKLEPIRGIHENSKDRNGWKQD